MAYEFMIVEKKEHLTIVTINRPEVMNALHPYASRELCDIFDDFFDDPQAWVAIITGAGDRAFCAGDDLKWTARHGREAQFEIMVPLSARGGFSGLATRFNAYKPVIAAVNGLALGGGFEAALAADIIVAAESAAFGLLEPKVGLAAAGGGVARLIRQIPYHLAMGMILTARQVTAKEAYRLGFVNEVVPLKDLMSAAERWAEELLTCAPLALRASKEIALKGMSLPLEEVIPITREDIEKFPELAKLQKSEDYTEGPRAFAEKRKPQWKGR